MVGIFFHTLSPSCLSNRWTRQQIKWTRFHLTMDALVLQHGCVRFSSWTRPLKSLDASAVLGGRIQSELRLRPSRKSWTRPPSAVDALGIFGKRVQTRQSCVHHFCGRVQVENVCVIGTCIRRCSRAETLIPITVLHC